MNPTSLSFETDKKEYKMFYLRVIPRLVIVGLPVGLIVYIVLVWTMGFSILAILLAILSACAANWLFRRFKMYKLYGLSGQAKSTVFTLNDTGFETTVGKAVKQYEYADISHIELIGNFVIIWLNNSTPAAVPIYSNAFNKIKRSEFIALLKAKMTPDQNFHPVAAPVND